MKVLGLAVTALVALASLVALPSGATQAAPTRLNTHRVYPASELRNANLAADAVERSLQYQRERDGYRASTRTVRVVQNIPVTAEQAKKYGFRTVSRGGKTIPLVLVETHLRDSRGMVWENAYLYDQNSHLLISSTERSGRVRAKNSPIEPLSY